MGDTDTVGEDYDFFFDDDWLYIEDEFAIADELAETQIPSPGYSGTNAELMHEWYEYDTYDYFGELEYGDDAFWDIKLAKTKQTQEQEQEPTGKQSPRKRKRTATAPHTEKRRKLLGQHQDPDVDPEWQTVVYRQSTSFDKSAPALTAETSTFALFPDWRRRFPSDAAMEWHNLMPEDMQRAAQAGEIIMDGNRDDDNDVELESKVSPKAIERPIRQIKQRKTTRMIARESEEAEDTSIRDPRSALDLEAIRTTLRSRLGNAGLDEEAFMSVISNMLAGDGTADAAVAQLAEALLDQQNDGDDDNAALHWLQDSGVNMPKAAEQEKSEGGRIDSGASFAKQATLCLSAVNSTDPAGHMVGTYDAKSQDEQDRKDTRTQRRSGVKR